MTWEIQILTGAAPPHPVERHVVTTEAEYLQAYQDACARRDAVYVVVRRWDAASVEVVHSHELNGRIISAQPARMLEKAQRRAYPSAQSDQAGEVAYWEQRVKAEQEKDER